MDRIKSLHEMLEGINHIADWIAQEIVSIPLEPKTDNLTKAVDSIANFVDLEKEIYNIRQDLTPEELTLESETDSDTIVYGPDNPMPEEIQEFLQLKATIKVLKIFTAYGKNKWLSELAEKEIPKLEEVLTQYNHHV